jgi:hypothetical protein
MVLAALVCAALGCSKGGSDDKPAAGAGDKPAEGAPVKKKSNIQHIVMAVPFGKQIACTDIFDAASMAKYIADVGEIRDRGSSQKDASFSCAFMRAGEPPKTDQQLKAYEKGNMKLGVLPGDEYCTVSGFCNMSSDPEEFKKSCQAKGDVGNEQLGAFACVHASQRGVLNAYTYRVVDPKTQCVLEVMGGPSVTDETLVQNCTRAGLDLVTPEKLKNPH